MLTSYRPRRSDSLSSSRRAGKVTVKTLIALAAVFLTLLGLVVKVLLAQQPAAPSPPTVAVIVSAQGQQGSEAAQLRAQLQVVQADRDRLQKEYEYLRKERDESDRRQRERDERAQREREQARTAVGDAPGRQVKDEQPVPLRYEEPPQVVRQPSPPAPKARPRLFDVAVTAVMENVKLHDCNPLLTLSESVVIRVGGRRLELGVQTNNRSVVGTVQLPAGTHKYVVDARAEGKWWPGNGHYPRRTAVTGTGAGDLVVEGDSQLVLKRSASHNGGYEVALVAVR
jgi:hypothetical protein